MALGVAVSVAVAVCVCAAAASVCVCACADIRKWIQDVGTYAEQSVNIVLIGNKSLTHHHDPPCTALHLHGVLCVCII